MVKLLVMTDLHLTTDGKRIIGLDPLARLQDGLAHARRNHPDADRLILTGDLAHFGQTKAYEALSQALAEAPWPTSFLLGNHDKRGTFRKVFPHCPVDINGFVQSIVDFEGVRLITLDTLDETGASGHGGRLCKQRLTWLEDQLTDARGKPCLVFLHHPPFMTGFDGMDDIRLKDDTAFLNTLASGNVAHVIAGHIHRTITAAIGGVPITVFKSTCHQMPMLLGKEGSEHSVDEPGAYGIVLANGSDVVVHFEDFTLPPQSVDAY